MKGAFNQEKALVGAFSVIVQPVVEPMEQYTALDCSEAAAVPLHPPLSAVQVSPWGPGWEFSFGLHYSTINETHTR